MDLEAGTDRAPVSPYPTLQAWRELYPEASVVSVTGNLDVIAEHFLESAEDFPGDLKEHLDVALIESPLLKEALVWHKPSKSLLVADSAFKVTCPLREGGPGSFALISARPNRS